VEQMNKTELIQLLEVVSAVDGRKVTEATINAWLPVLATTTYADSVTALTQCRSDERINWVEPKHILAKAKDIVRKRIEAAESKELLKPRSGNPCPTCIHKKPLVECLTCCKAMAHSATPDKTFFDLTGVRV